tara:strand:- start:347 stop:487 length:141 start_codon:yes stop_codon:yes gene_type:complete
VKGCNCNTVATVLKKAEREKERRDIGIIETAKKRGFIDRSGRITQA